jgi:magnesium transporter
MIRLQKYFRKRGKAIGLTPGTPLYTGEEKEEKVRITLIDYNADQFLEKEISAAEDCFVCRDSSSVSWINLDGIHDTSLIENLGLHFDLHPLVMEDITNSWQRPKMESYDHFLYVVVKMLSYDEPNREVTGEQVSFILGKHVVLSFQERPGDIFEPVRERIRTGKGRIRRMGPDYLVYALLDTIVDQYFVILEKVGEHIEELEEAVVSDPRPETLHEIHKLKREMIFLRKSIWPLRELVNGLEREESSLVTKPTLRYLRDAYDHTIQVIDTVETFRDMLSGMHDTYLSSISNRMNEIMKVLTIIATIFIPLTFIAGIYGMNFEFMPELKWPWAYPAVWFVMLLLAGFMVLYFRRKRWF